MTAGTRVAAFGALLAAIFALAVLAGRAIGPSAEAEPAHDARAGAAAPGDAVSGHADPSVRPAESEAALRFVTGDTTLTAGRSLRFTFAVRDAHGRPVRDFEVEQGRRMHLIVVRRDLRRFAHLHPVQDRSGRWSVRVRLPDAGVYHAFADFQTAGTRHTLGTDLFAGGRFEPLALPAPSPTAHAAGYDVALRPGAKAGELRFAVSRDGAPVDLQPYLGANGHLVMLRAGDLAYEHVHPLPSSTLAFDTAGAAPGTYRLFLQFRHADRVRTVAFTRAVTR
jgi:hypothetical protein